MFRWACWRRCLRRGLHDRGTLLPMTEPDTDKLVLVVVGAHLRAELHDRQAAHHLRDALDEAVSASWMSKVCPARQDAADIAPGDSLPPSVIVLTDLRRLNDPLLAPLPQVSVGHPELNALSAFLADKLPPAFVIDGELAVQFDAASPEAIALCWGTDHHATRRAVDEFIGRYIESFADAVVRELGTEHRRKE